MTFCGLCGSRSDYDDGLDDGERRPLLANGDEETVHQQRLHQKLHTYQMVRAMGSGYLPSTTQTVANLERLLPGRPSPGLSPSGRALTTLTTRFGEQVIALLQHKNGGDEIQDFAWCVQRARLDVNVDVPVDVGQFTERAAFRAGQAVTHANAAYRSLETVGTLLLTNAPFRLFLVDLTAIGREVFRDTAVSLAEASQAAASNVGQGQQQERAANGVTAGTAKDKASVKDNVVAVTDEVVAGASKVAADAQDSVATKLVDNDAGARDRLLGRLKEAVGTLRQRPDYAESVSVLTILLQKYVAGYVRAAETVVEAAEEAVEDVRTGVSGTLTTNDEADVALRNFWAFVTNFGSRPEWTALDTKFRALLDRSSGDNRRVDLFLKAVGRTLEAMLTDPSFFDHVDERLGALREQADALQDALASSNASSSTSIREDFDALLAQAKRTLQSVANDRDVAQLAATATRMADLLWPAADGYVNTDLLGDAVSVFVPQLVQAVQFIPIPRLEVVSPDVDLLLEGLVLEPGWHKDAQARSCGSTPSSFLPYNLHVQVRNDVDIRATQVGHRHGTASSVGTAATVTIRGLSVAADDFGYVLRVHANPLLRFRDEGIASFRLDERGVDVQLEVDVVRGAADRVLALKRVHVRIHHLDFSLRESKVAWLVWLLKPVLRPLLKETLQRQLAASLQECLHTVNRELVFARERMRAAQVATAHSSASSLASIVPIVRAVLSRFRASNEENPEVDVSIGFGQGPTGVFDGVYAPGSLVRVWREEAVDAQRRIDEDAATGHYARDGWRNGIFDVPVVE